MTLIDWRFDSVSVMSISLLEAPRIDGASELYIFHKIAFSVIAFGIAAMSVGAFIDAWNNYRMPPILLNSSKRWTLSIIVASPGTVRDIAGNIGATYGTVAISVVPITYYSLYEIADQYGWYRPNTHRGK